MIFIKNIIKIKGKKNQDNKSVHKDVYQYIFLNAENIINT